MFNPVLYLLSASLVPELSSDVSTGAASNRHLCLVSITAIRTLPKKLSIFLDNSNFTVVSALVAIITLGVDFTVLDIVVDELDYLKHSRDIVRQVGNLDIGDSSTR
jgi:hypothetical protein